MSFLQEQKELLEFVMLVCKVLPTYKEESDKEDTTVKMSVFFSLEIE